MSVAPAVGEAVLTVGYQVARYALHVVHLTQAAHRVLDEEEAGAERADDAERVAVHLVGPCSLDRLGQERAGGGVLAAVVTDGGDAERGAVMNNYIVDCIGLIILHTHIITRSLLRFLFFYLLDVYPADAVLYLILTSLRIFSIGKSQLICLVNSHFSTFYILIVIVSCDNIAPITISLQYAKFHTISKSFTYSRKFPLIMNLILAPISTDIPFYKLTQ